MYCRHLVKARIHGNNNKIMIFKETMLWVLKILRLIGSDTTIILLLKDSEINKNNAAAVFDSFNAFNP